MKLAWLLSTILVLLLSLVAGVSEPQQVVTIDEITSHVNIRTGPSTNNDIVGELAPGRSATLVSEHESWFEIELSDGRTGFVHRDWTEKIDSEPRIAETQTAYRPESLSESETIVTADRVTTYVNVRAGPTRASAVIDQLRPGQSAMLVRTRERWFEIKLTDGVTGFVHRGWTRKGEPVRNLVQTQTADTSNSPPLPAKPERDRTVLLEATNLLEQDRSDEAFRLLSGLEIEWAGDSGFDYLYGITALDSGHADEAIFALERVVKLLPGFTGARMELARALFDVGDYDLAESEFNTLLQEDPPAEVRGIIMAFLEIIHKPKVDTKLARSQKLFYVLAAGGHDSNVNGAADINSFLGFTLDPRSTEQDSPFAEAAFGGILKKPLRPGLNLILQGDARHRYNKDAGFVDNTFVSSTVGLGFTKGKNRLNAGLAATWSEIDGSFNERGYALDLGWNRLLKNDNLLRARLRAGPVEYTTALKVRDLDRLLYTLTLRQSLQDGAGELDWTLIGGRDMAKDRTTPYSNSRAGARASAKWSVGGNDLLFGMGYLKIPYNGTSFFGIDRDDSQFTTSLALRIRDKPVKGWTFVPNLSYVKNNSNVPIYDYDRVQIGVQFRAVR